MSETNQNSSNDQQNEPPKDGHQAVWVLNEPIDVDAYEPINANIDSMPIVVKVESINEEPKKSEEIKTEQNAFIHICNLLGLKSDQPLQDLKDELKQKKRKLSPDQDLDSDKANTCKSVFISQMPLWFQHFHVKALIQLASNFDATSESYCIDMFKDNENKNTGECLLRFQENKDCLQVYEDLQGIPLSDGPIKVNLDLDDDIADARAKCDPKLQELLLKYSECDKQSRANNRGCDDDVEIIEPETAIFIGNFTVKTEKPEYSTETEDHENAAHIKQEPMDQDIVIKSGVNSQDNPPEVESEESNSTSDDPTQQTVDPENDEMSNCKIIHIMNIGKTFKIRAFRKWIKQLLGYALHYMLCQVKDEHHNPTGDAVLEFTSHKDAEIVLIHFTGLIYEAPHKLEIVWGIGYTFAIHLTEADIRSFKLKRKLNVSEKYQTISYSTEQERSIRDDRQAAKRPRIEHSKTLNDSSSDENYETGYFPFEERCYEAFGLSKKFMQKWNLKTPFSRTVIVLRLSDDIVEEKLFEVFSLAGEVKKIKMFPDQNYQNRIQATIEYDHPLEAVQAITMFHKQKLYNQEMLVEMEHLPSKPVLLPAGLAGIGPGLAQNGAPQRALRFIAELRLIHDLFVDLDIMERIPNPDKPMKFIYKKQKNKDRHRAERFNNKFCLKCHSCSCDKPKDASGSDKSSNKSGTSNVTSNSNKKIPESTLLAIQALGTVLISQGIIPVNTDCKSLQNILNAVQNNIAAKQKTVPNQQNSNPGTSTSGQNVGNSTPKQNVSLNQAIDQVLQFMPQISNIIESHNLKSTNTGNSNNQKPSQNMQNPENPGLLPTPSVRISNPNTQPTPKVPPGLLPTPLRFRPQMPHPQNFIRHPIPNQPSYEYYQAMHRSNLKEVAPQNMQNKDKKMETQSFPAPPSFSKGTPQEGIKSLQETVRNSETLVFTNLPPCVTTYVLANKMRELGELKFCEMTGRGRAFVRFQLQVDAFRCIRLFHRSKVDGQIIEVRFL